MRGAGENWALQLSSSPPSAFFGLGFIGVCWKLLGLWNFGWPGILRLSTATARGGFGDGF